MFVFIWNYIIFLKGYEDEYMNICKALLGEAPLKEPDSEAWREQTRFLFFKCVCYLKAWFQLTNSKLSVIPEGLKESSILYKCVTEIDCYFCLTCFWL